MFSEMIAALKKNRMPDSDTLQKRYDFALTKKLGIVKLPPAFWMRDSKINPRSDHLLWAALLLRDHKRIEMAMSVLAAEMAETASSEGEEFQREVEGRAGELAEKLIELFPDPAARQKLKNDLFEIVPELFGLTSEKT